MCVGGFAKYMDKLEAGRSLYDVVSAPLKYVKNPYMLAMAGFIVDQLLGMAIPSASGLGLLMMVTMYPVFIRAGVPRMTAVCVIAAGRFFDLGPGSASCNMACKTAGIEWADYFLNWQMGIYWALLPTMLVTMYFAQKYWDKREGLDPDLKRCAKSSVKKKLTILTKLLRSTLCSPFCRSSSCSRSTRL